MNSQIIRKTGPEVDSLWIGTGRSVEDLSKPEIIIESTAGESHPGSMHLQGVSNSVRNAVYATQGTPAQYTVTDICDGVATGHSGMSYSLVSRDMIAAMVEIHARGCAADGLVTVSSCDKAIPGHLMAVGRLNIPAVHVPGGSMMPGPQFISTDTSYRTNLRVAEGKMSAEEEFYYKLNECPSCGACQIMGTASTMQCMSEALGLALPANAIVPANSNYLHQMAMDAGKAVVNLVRKGIRPSDIMVREAFENAIMIHAAIGGSTNAVLHLPAIAAELGIPIKLDDFQKLTEGIPLLTSLLTAGKWPTQYLWLAGGIPRIMLELKDFLHMDLMTVTGKTIRENLEDLERIGHFRRCREYMGNYRMSPEEIIKSIAEPENTDSGVAILKGNIAPEGAVIKHYAVDKSMHHFVGRARVFDSEFEATDAIYEDRIHPGEVVIIRYCGKHAAGMPEMLKATDAICNKPNLNKSCALITDGRFSGASWGPCIGYLLPEALDGGPIGLVEEDDLIEIDVKNRTLNIVGTAGERMEPGAVDVLLATRRENHVPKQIELKGALKYMAL